MEEIYFEIEKYLDGEMSAEEVHSFEARLEKEPESKFALENVRALRKSLQEEWAGEADVAALEKNLESLGNQYFRQKETDNSTIKNETNDSGINKPIERRMVPYRYVIAAAVLLLLAAVLFFFPRGEKNLYADYRSFPNASFTLRGNTEATMAAAEKAFNAGDYKAASPIFEQLIREKPEDSEVRFFAALSYLESGKNGEAIRLLDALRLEENVWSGEARWFAALAYVQTKNFAKAKEVLISIPPADRHYLEGQKLLDELMRD